MQIPERREATLQKPFDSRKRPFNVELIKGADGSIFALEVSDLGESCASVGLPNPDLTTLETLVQVTRARIIERLGSVSEAFRFGIFSYLLEAVRNLPKEVAQSCAVEIASAFQERNQPAKGDRIDREALEHFAKIIDENHYDWEGFSIAFLDPEAAQLDRLRRNLELSPAERLEQHNNFLAQIRRARRA